LIINRPGAYKLCEDITFKPQVNHPAAAGNLLEDPFASFQPDLSIYDPRAYGLGFFAAISVATSDVQLYLNGYTLEQSREHQLAQRFYANIELASAPFIASTGPHEFVGNETQGGQLYSARNFYLFGPGVIGRSAHHGVHGNENQKVQISGVTFQDFEVAAVSLNKVDGLEISDCVVIRNSREVPVNGMFSAAHFITPYGKYLAENYPDRSITFGWWNFYDSFWDRVNPIWRAARFCWKLLSHRCFPAPEALISNTAGGKPWNCPCWVSVSC